MDSRAPGRWADGACGMLRRMSPPSPPGTWRTAALGAGAALLHLGFDAACSTLTWARPPYLRMEDLPEAFRQLPLVSAPVAVSVAASAVSGLLAVIALLAVEPGAPRRWRQLTGVVTGFWLFTALLTWLVWLSSPFTRALPGIALGIPRGLAVGWLLWRGSGGEASGGEASGGRPAGAA